MVNISCTQITFLGARIAGCAELLGHLDGNITVFRAFRFLRFLRFLRATRVIVLLEPLQVLVAVILNSMSDLGSMSFLMALFCFIFTALGMELFGGLLGTEQMIGNPPEEYVSRWHFNNFLHGFLTTFQIMTLMDWQAVMYEPPIAIGTQTLFLGPKKY
jgi:hypothetical protein